MPFFFLSRLACLRQGHGQFHLEQRRLQFGPQASVLLA
jgi:hypothetical protein